MELTPEMIAEYMKTPEGALELQQILVEMEMDQGSIGASADAIQPDISGATQIGASPNIRGATIGLPPEISGINPVEENEKNRRRMLEQLIPSRGRGLGLGY
jgi:hypothetical protein